MADEASTKHKDYEELERDAARRALESAVWHVATYRRLLLNALLPADLVQALVLDYHRSMFAPRDRGYTRHFDNYDDYLATFGFQKGG